MAEDCLDEFTSLYGKIWMRDANSTTGVWQHYRNDTEKGTHEVFTGLPLMKLDAFVNDTIGGGDAIFEGHRGWTYILDYRKCRDLPNLFVSFSGNFDDMIEDLMTAKLSL